MSVLGAVAVLMNRTQQTWEGKKVAVPCNLFMDVKAAFNNVSKVHLGERMEELEIEVDLIRWTMSFRGAAGAGRSGATSFMSDRQVKFALDGEVRLWETRAQWIRAFPRDRTHPLHHVPIGHIQRSRRGSNPRHQRTILRG